MSFTYFSLKRKIDILKRHTHQCLADIPKMHKAYLISGLSGVGKTTLGFRIDGNHRDILFIDQDVFFRPEKPFAYLKCGVRVKNWDCTDSVDWERLNKELAKLLEETDIVLVGFCLRDQYLPALKDRIYNHVELIYEKDEKERSREARLNSKPGIDAVKDKMIVDELVWPFYLETRQQSTVDHTIVVYRGDDRRSADEIYQEWLKIPRR